MIVLGNSEFGTGFKLAGIKESYIINNREEGLKILKNVDRKEFIVANVKVIGLIPELAEFKNVVSIPDNANQFSTTDDLKEIIKTAVGIDINI